MRLNPTLYAIGAVALLALAAGAPVLAKENVDAPAAQPGDTITWAKDLTRAFEEAAKEKKPVMICINSKRVDDGRIEPAAKGLREVVYKDPRIVGKSRRFICVFLTSEGSSDDYGELRMRFGIEGLIVSPQHIFAHPEHKPGQPPLARREYWPYGKGETAVKALLEMMDKALAAYGTPDGAPEVPSMPTPPAEPEAGSPAAPDGELERKAWIAQLIGIVKDGEARARREALLSLVLNDKDGDCIKPLIEVMPVLAKAKHVEGLTDVVRVLGRPGLEEAAEPIAVYLKHKDDALRGNAAVSLEYIGCMASVGPLTERVMRERVEANASHMYRALGRCGVGEAKVRALLVKKAQASKSQHASYGPIIGLAYFEKDAKAARSAEKLLKRIAGGWQDSGRRALLAWCVSEIVDSKSGKFMRKEMIEPLRNTQAFWVGAVRAYYEAIAQKCEGDASVQDAIDRGVTVALEFAGGTKTIHDDARRDRDTSQFEPKGDWDLEARTWGGRGPGGRGGGGRGGGGGR